jgi:hypothetical protein
MSGMLIEMDVKMAICDRAFVDLHRQEFRSIGEQLSHKHHIRIHQMTLLKKRREFTW